MVLNKKGIFVTMIAVIVSSILVVIFSVVQEPPLDHELESVSLSVDLVNNYLSNIDGYIGNTLILTSRNAISETVDRMIEEGSYYENYTEAFIYCLQGEDFEINENLYECTNTLDNMFEKWNNFTYENSNINASYELDIIELKQVSTWYFLLNSTLYVSVNNSYANWNVKREMPVLIPIEGLKDPTYYLELHHNVVSNNMSSIIVSKENQKLWTRQPEGYAYTWQEKPSTINKVIINSSGNTERIYFAYSSAPSYMDRLNNNLSVESEFGIVSIVPPALVEADYPHLDYLYWRSECDSSHTYIQYDFWKDGIGDGDRTLYGINESEPGLNASIVKQSIATQTNMSNSTYFNHWNNC